MNRAEIGRGASFKVKEEVAESGSILHWEFVSTDYDIAFGVSLVSDGQKQDLVNVINTYMKQWQVSDRYF